MKALWRCTPIEIPLDPRNIASGDAYQPTLYAGYDNSRGTGESIPGRLTSRAYESLSQIEMKFFHLAHLNPFICDIREQYPACSEELFAKLIADPTYRPARREVPTLDFVLTLRPDGNAETYRYVAISVKPSCKLNEATTIRRFIRERHFCEQLEWAWYLVTERDVSEVAAENARRIYYWIKRDELAVSAHDAERLGKWLLTNKASDTLSNLLHRGSRALDLPSERMPHLFATTCYLNIVQPDMRKRLDLRAPLCLKRALLE